MKVWVNGVLVDGAAAKVSVFDHGLTVGDGVFETMRVYDGTPFALTRHLRRLARSAAGLGLPAPGDDVIRRAATEVVEANGSGDLRLRITVTGGAAPLGSGRGEAGCTVIAAVGHLDPIPPTTTVVTVPWTRNERSAVAGLKTTSYGENVVALARARQAGASEALFANTAGRLCEGTGTNVFVVVGGRLLTPPLTSGCLAGVTRALLLEIAEAAEEDLPFEVLAEADEVFLTSSTREVQAVSAVDDNPLLDPPGPRTQAAADAYRALVARDLDP